MESNARLLGHPIHQMLIVFPLGLLGTAVVFDVIAMVSDSGTMAAMAYWLIAAGVVGALIAAPFGTIDWLAIPKRTRARRIGALHGGGNLVVTLLFAGSWLLRHADGAAPAAAHALSFAGVALSLITAWLGGELVCRLAVGVSPDANLDAPSSLRTTVRVERAH